MRPLIRVFSNHHDGHEMLDSVRERELFIRTTGLLTPPDRVRVTVGMGPGAARLKNVLTV